ncbi:MAG TPA: KpsF/GutQ family sugar-phosphate isomerase [Bacteroidales bacterium]|nr:KpsF/GutQ family sugar-phosphate isomerase [Bacteroidales bacterium]MDD4086320.1 KpsF/GutQ family sugar-phosphate isomerase [Bacteroidales bacterium]MDY0084577.1 KpsF/GutQ family sugar-phosphate isomerase [Bacteroidales bacterium]HPE43026.1 KpsF/GutQ family sugar-phosphate isomerase [Bacteroidales bacterium]
MKSTHEIVQIAKRVISHEREAIGQLIEGINEDFAKAVSLIFNSKGNVVVTGIGKSANIAQKIVATFNSTGTNAVFMHAADAIHGDLGIIRNEDVILALSKSGETPEIKVLVPLIKSRGNKLIAVVSNADSYLALQADFVLDTFVKTEACPNNLAPTSSTTAQLVMGDALAVALLECRGFTAEDFARFHPGGALGKKLYLRVEDLYVRNEKPAVKPDAELRDVIVEISAKRLGAAAVVENGLLLGIITDGDLRRMLMKTTQISGLKAVDVMTANPKAIDHQSLVVDALQIMRNNNITQLPVLKDGNYVGVIHLHDILHEGIL